MELSGRLLGFKHFLFTGVAFAIALGWLATMLVNNTIGLTVETALGIVLTDYYLGALLLTVVSITAIGLCILLGNRLFIRWVSNPLDRKNIAHSTILFSLFVMVVVLPEIGGIIDSAAHNLSHTYRNPADVLLMISLPVIRLTLLPAFYYLVTRRQFVRADA